MDILVVEDDVEINELLGIYIEQSGYTCRRVGTGADAIAAAMESCPSVVLLDMMLPDLTGVEICKKLRAIACTKNVVVIFLTACHMENIRNDAHEAGATDFFTKPFDPDRLMENVEMRLRGMGIKPRVME